MEVKNLSSVGFSTNLLLVDPETGEHLDVDTHMNFHKHYTPKILNTKVSDMRLRDVQIEVCVSSSATKLFWIIVDNLDRTNSLSRIADVARDNEVTQKSLGSTIKKLVDVGFLKRTNRGVYFANPFVLVSRKVNSGKEIIQLQNSWDKL